jgi:hypothetical protein
VDSSFLIANSFRPEEEGEGEGAGGRSVEFPVIKSTDSLVAKYVTKVKYISFRSG